MPATEDSKKPEDSVEEQKKKLEAIEKEHKKLLKEIEKLQKEKADHEPVVFTPESRDERMVYYSQIIGGEKNMSSRVSEWPSNEYLRKLSAQEMDDYQITKVQWVKGSHFGADHDYANSLRFTNNRGDESNLYSDKTPDASIEVNQRIAKITCRTNYHHVFGMKFYNDFDEVIGESIYSKYDERSEEEYTVYIGLDEKLVGFKVWESDWVDCKTSKIAFKMVKTDQYQKDEDFMEKVRRYKLLSESKLLTNLNYILHEGQDESLIKFKQNGTITWKNQDNQGKWHLEAADTVNVKLNNKEHFFKYDMDKLHWQSNFPDFVVKEIEKPLSKDSWFCIHYADFCFGDKSSESCESFSQGIEIALTKPKDSSIAYQYWVGHKRIFTKPAGNGATWTNEHTGSGKQEGRQGHLFVWGSNMGVSKQGRTLICMKDVGIRGGDGPVDEEVMTFQQAFAKIKSSDKTESAFVWDAKEKKLVEKPASTRKGTWDTAPGSYMFMWADSVITEESVQKMKPVKTDVSLMKHETFENQNTWTQSRKIARSKDGMLVTAEEAQEYIKTHGALVKGQASWTATEEPNGLKNWVSCGDQNSEGLAVDHRKEFKSYPEWAEKLDFVKGDKPCDWAGQVVIYKPYVKVTKKADPEVLLTAIGTLVEEVDKKDERPRVKLTLKSHDGKAVVKSSKEYMHEGIPVDFFTVGDRNQAQEVIMERHKDGLYIRMDHRFDEGALDCFHGKYHEGNEVGAWKCHKGGNQWFQVNPDLTITPTHSVNMCLGFKEGDDKISLVKREKPAEGQKDSRLFFDAVTPTIVPEKVMPMILSSHPGKAVVLKNEIRQHGHGMEEMIKLGDEKDAISIFVDEDNHVHNADKHFQTFDGYEHETRDLEFFTKHDEYGHQKYKPQEDGTILFLGDQEYVLGTDEKVSRVMHVLKDSPHKFIFRDIKNLL